jgi:hypothetical protein
MENSVLFIANELINGERQLQYGSPVKNFEDIARIASVLIGREITPAECVKVLIATKLAREGNKHKRDNLIDACGYIDILDMVEGRE